MRLTAGSSLGEYDVVVEDIDNDDDIVDDLGDDAWMLLTRESIEMGEKAEQKNVGCLVVLAAGA